MLPKEIDKPLSQIEAQCAALAIAVEHGDPQAVEMLGGSLRQMAVDFSALMAHVHTADPTVRARLHKLSAVLTSQRENLIRRRVVVERAVQVLLPTAQLTPTGTYAGASRGGSQAYRAMSSH